VDPISRHLGERARALVSVNVHDVVFVVDAEGERFRFAEVNPAFTQATGLDEEQIVGKFVDEVVPEPSLAMVLGNYRTAISEGRTVRWNETTDYPAGRKYGEVSITPMVDPDGTCRHLIGTVHDVTAETRNRELNAAEQDVFKRVVSGQPLQGTLAVLVLVIEKLAPASLASILLLTPDGKQMFHGAAPSLPEEYVRAIDGIPVESGRGSCTTAAAERRTVIVTDIETDPLWDRYRSLGRAHELRACWSTPILRGDGRVLGTCAVYFRQTRSPTEDERALIDRVVSIAAIAIGRHELNEQLRALSARIETAREEERASLAREIHENLGQTLAVLKMDLSWISRRAKSSDGIAMDALLDKVDQMSQMTDELIDRVLRISSELRPSLLDDLGLEAALAWLANEFERRTGIACGVHVRGVSDEVRPELSTAVFRVLQEALTNVERHAQAQSVDVVLHEMEGMLCLDVVDDGRGIRTEELQDPRSLGLLGMSERIRRLGGLVAFEMGRDGGTTVTFRIPIESDGPPSA
jgi:PAS domain S-box-containing protein